MKREYPALLFFWGMLSFCGGNSSKQTQDSDDPAATGNVIVQYANYFSGNSFITPGKYIYFFQNDGNNMPITKPQRVRLKATGGTVKSGVKSAYTWTITGLPSWLELNQDTSEFYLQVKPADQTVEPKYATTQIKQITITNGGSGYSGTTNFSVSGTGYGLKLANPSYSGGVITSVATTDPGIAYTSNPTVSQTFGSGTGAVLTAVAEVPIPIVITVKSDENKTTVINTSIVVVFNDQAVPAPNEYPNVLNAYIGSNYVSTETAGDNDTTTTTNDKNGDCDINASPVHYQAIMPGQTIISAGGSAGKDCYAFNVPADDILTSFTISTTSEVEPYISKCDTAKPDACDYANGTANATYSTLNTTWQNNVLNNTTDGCYVTLAGGNKQIIDFTEYLTPVNKVKLCNGTTSPGTGASMEMVLTNGVITGINILAGGSGYTAATIQFSGLGTGAAATPTLAAGVLTGISIGNGGTGYGYPFNFVTKTTDTGIYACPYSASGSCESKTIAMEGNSLYNPLWQKVNSRPRTWRWSMRFNKNNGMPISASLAKNVKCDTTATFASSNCMEDLSDSGASRAWKTGPGWYFLIVKSKQTYPNSSNTNQPYTIKFDLATD